MENILNNIVLLLSNGLATYVIYRFMHVFFERRVVDRKVTFCMYLLQYIISSFVLVRIPYLIINVVVSILCYGIIVYCYEGTLWKKIIVIAVIYSCGFVIEGFVFILLENTNNVLLEKRHIDALASVLVESLEWLVMIILEKKLKSLKKDITPPFVFTLTVVGEVILICVQEILIFQQKNINDSIRILSVLVTLILTIIIVYLYASLSTIAKEQVKNQIMEREKNYYHNQAELLQSGSENLREFRHDIKNKILVLNELLNKNEIERASAYIREFADKIEQRKSYSQSGNMVIDSIINYKLSLAEKQGCHIQTEISLPYNISIDDDDLVVVLGNLLDNAIEATAKLKENKYIQVTIKYDRKCLFVKVVNSFDAQVIERDGRIQTRKENEEYHGIGLQSVKNIANKYCGDLKIVYKAEVFSVGVVLYSKEKDT